MIFRQRRVTKKPTNCSSMFLKKPVREVPSKFYNLPRGGYSDKNWAPDDIKKE